MEIIILLLAVIGGWFLYHSYQEGTLKSNLTEAVDGISNAAKNVTKLLPER
jgi:hypothetical protein